jgi:hypothetical protein
LQSLVSLRGFVVLGILLTYFDLIKLNEGTKVPGQYSILLNAHKFGKGLYFYTLKIGEKSLTKKMIITE